MLGDKQVDYNETFRLFLVTRNPEPYLPPDLRSLVAVTNFTVTRSGLEGATQNAVFHGHSNSHRALAGNTRTSFKACLG